MQEVCSLSASHHSGLGTKDSWASHSALSSHQSAPQNACHMLFEGYLNYPCLKDMAVSLKFASAPAEKLLLAALGPEAVSFLPSTSNRPPTSADSSPCVLHPNLSVNTQAFAAISLGLWLTYLGTILTLVYRPFIQTLGCYLDWIHSILLCL